MNLCSHSSISAVGTTGSISIDLDPATEDVASDATKHADNSCEESSLPPLIKEQIHDKFIGNAILEYADKRDSFYPHYPVSNI